jgi:hypothetical protein
LEIFQVLESKYSEIGEWWIASQIEIVCAYLEKMWRISESRTTIKKE